MCGTCGGRYRRDDCCGRRGSHGYRRRGSRYYDGYYGYGRYGRYGRYGGYYGYPYGYYDYEI